MAIVCVYVLLSVLGGVDGRVNPAHVKQIQELRQEIFRLEREVKERDTRLRREAPEVMEQKRLQEEARAQREQARLREAEERTREAEAQVEAERVRLAQWEVERNNSIYTHLRSIEDAHLAEARLREARVQEEVLRLRAEEEGRMAASAERALVAASNAANEASAVTKAMEDRWSTLQEQLTSLSAAHSTAAGEVARLMEEKMRADESVRRSEAERAKSEADLARAEAEERAASNRLRAAEQAQATAREESTRLDRLAESLRQHVSGAAVNATSRLTTVWEEKVVPELEGILAAREGKSLARGWEVLSRQHAAMQDNAAQHWLSHVVEEVQSLRLALQGLIAQSTDAASEAGTTRGAAVSAAAQAAHNASLQASALDAERLRVAALDSEARAAVALRDAAGAQLRETRETAEAAQREVEALRLQSQIAHANVSEVELRAELARDAAAKAEAEQARADAELATRSQRAEEAASKAREAEFRAKEMEAQVEASEARVREAELRYAGALVQKETALAQLEAARVQLEMMQLNVTREEQSLSLAAETRRASEARRAAAESEAEAKRLELERAERDVERETLHRDRLAEEARRDAERRAEELQLRRQMLEEEDRLERARAVSQWEREHTAAKEREQWRRETELMIEEEKRSREMAVETARMQAEVDGRIRQERENEDIALRRAREQAEAEQRRWRVMIRESLDGIGLGVQALLGPYLQRTLTTIVLVSLGIYCTREVVRVAGSEFERRVSQPQLVRDTSARLPASLARVQAWLGCCVGSARCRCSRNRRVRPRASDTAGLKQEAGGRPRRGGKGVKRGGGGGGGGAPNGHTVVPTASGSPPDVLHAAFADVVLDPQLDAAVRALTVSTRNARRNRAPLRHVMFYGPPGTGKTLVARRIAEHCGLDYAIMSGGDVAPLGNAAVAEIHKLFDWAKQSSRGLVLFIDEAEAFLGSRGRTGGVSESLRNVLSALLYETGRPSSDYMVIMATNRPEDLDSAITDRVDQALFFPLPSASQRRAMLRQYLELHVLERCHTSDVRRAVGTWGLGPREEDAERQVGVDDDESQARRLWRAWCGAEPPPLIRLAPNLGRDSWERLVDATDGFSGRQIAKFLLNVQACAYAREECLLTADDLEHVLRAEQEKHRNRARQLAGKDGGLPWWQGIGAVQNEVS